MIKMAAGVNGAEDGLKQWQSLVRQTELTAQLCSITRDVRNIRGNTQKKIEKLRQLLSGLLSELTYFDEVVQMVSLMDRLLKLENLDLHLTPYKVLATGQDEGMLEFIPSRSLAQVRGYGNAQGQGAGSGSRKQGSGGVLTRAGSLWGTSSAQASTAGARDPVAVVEGQKRVKKLFKECRWRSRYPELGW